MITHWPCLEHVIADGGQGLERGVKLANAARCAQGEAVETISRQAMTMGLDVFHTQRELERVLQRQWKRAERQLETASQADAKVERYKRQGRDPRGVSGVAGRAWRKAEGSAIRRGTPKRPCIRLPPRCHGLMPRGGSIAVKPRRPNSTRRASSCKAIVGIKSNACCAMSGR